jgi:hypothetical protein
MYKKVEPHMGGIGAVNAPSDSKQNVSSRAISSFYFEPLLTPQHAISSLCVGRRILSLQYTHHFESQRTVEIPLTARLSCLLTVNIGKPLACRDKRTSASFELEVQEGYDVLRAKFKATFTANELSWTDDIDIYIKPSKQALQKYFVILDAGTFATTLTLSWRNARLRREGHEGFQLELFDYIPKAKPISTLHRATENRVQQALLRVREFEEANVSFGDATLRYAATTQVRLADTQPAQVPDSATFRQLQNIDELQRRNDTQQHVDAEYADIEVKINGAQVVLHMKLSDLRRALLPNYPLCPPYRAPISPSLVRQKTLSTWTTNSLMTICVFRKRSINKKIFSIIIRLT